MVGTYRLNERTAGKWWPVIWVAGATLLLFAVLVPGRQAREKARRAQCISNEKQIARAMAMYWDDNGKCPRKLDDLRKYISSDNVFHCPSAIDASEPSYQIFCGSNSTDIIVRENPADHAGAGGNVTYADGHVEWIPVSFGLKQK
jgi:prepilin-type processing-associated H-X9-DG protein